MEKIIMVQTRAISKRLYEKPVIGYVNGKLDDGTLVSVEIISKQGETECYNYNGNILISANNFKVNTIKPLNKQIKQQRYSSANIVSYVSIPTPNFIGITQNKVVSFGDNIGPIQYFDINI